MQPATRCIFRYTIFPRKITTPSAAPFKFKPRFINLISFSPLSVPLIRTMATIQQEYRLAESPELKNGQKVTVKVEGIDDASVLLMKVNNQLRALGTKCTHYGAPLEKGVLTDDGRITCPWHGACFNTDTGDIENAPALDHLNAFPVTVKDGAIYITSNEATIKSNKRAPNIRCKPSELENVVIVGGGSGGIGAIEGLREKGYRGKITLLGKEPYLPIDRTKLSKAMIPDASKLQWRDEEFMKSIGVEYHLGTEVESVDFDAKKAKTKDGKEWPYTKIIFATGGTPKRLPMKGFNDLENIFVLRQVEDVQAILKGIGEGEGKKIAFIGSSFIGMEGANCLASKKHNVTVIGMENAPLERVMGPEVGKIFQRILENNGVKFKLGTGVESAEPSKSDPSKVGSISLKGGDSVECDVCILAVGVSPATGYLQQSGVSVLKDNSVEVDEYYRLKGKEDAYAVGDIATFPWQGPGSKGSEMIRIEHWNVAQNAGRQAALHIATKRKPVNCVPIYWSAIGVQLRYCGASPNGYDDLIIKGKPEENSFVAYYTLGDEVVCVATMQQDPVMAQSAELMRRKRMPSKQDIINGANVLDIYVPAGVKI